MKKRLQNKKGFTLVELIVVIAIIAILAALAVPRVEDFVDDARQAQRKADFRTMYTGITAGYTDWIAEDAANELAGPTDAEITADANAVKTYDLSTLTGTDKLLESVNKRIPAGHELTTKATETADGTTGDKLPSVKRWFVQYTINGDGEVSNVTIENDGYTSVNGEEPTKN